MVGKKDWEIESNCNGYNQSTTTKRANSNLNNGKHIEYSWSHTACSNPIITAGVTPTQNTSLSIKNILVLDLGYRRNYVIWVIHSFIISYAYFFSLHSPLFPSILSFPISFLSSHWWLSLNMYVCHRSCLNSACHCKLIYLQLIYKVEENSLFCTHFYQYPNDQ